MGWLGRQLGLACDSVVSFEVVTAEGDVLRASEAEHPDLYWALRGGGGNFGVVTEFEFRLHDTGTRALSVEVDFPVEQATTTMRGWRDLDASAPREATFTAGIGGGVVTLGFVWVGDPQRGEALVPDIRALGRPSAERVVPMTYVELQSRDDVVDGHARRRYSKGHYFRGLTDQIIDTMVAVTDVGPYAPGVGLQAYGGAIADVPEGDTAFSHRDTAFELGASAGWTDPAEDDVRIETARAYAATLEPFASGVYVNVLGDEGAAGVRRAYSAEADPADRGEGHVRPAERVPPQPEHPPVRRHRGRLRPGPPTATVRWRRDGSLVPVSALPCAPVVSRRPRSKIVPRPHDGPVPDMGRSDIQRGVTLSPRLPQTHCGVGGRSWSQTQ